MDRPPRWLRFAPVLGLVLLLGQRVEARIASPGTRDRSDEADLATASRVTLGTLLAVTVLLLLAQLWNLR